MSLPVPMMNVINGGAHATTRSICGVHDPAGGRRLPRGRRAALAPRFPRLKKPDRQQRGWPTQVGDEGGFAPDLKSNEEALMPLMQAIEKAGYKPGEQIALGLDRCQRVPAGRQVPPRRRGPLADQRA